LIKLLNSKSSEIRCAVVSALCEKKRSDAAIDLMINCLSDESIEVKRIVADNIYIQMDSRAVEPLINVLQDKDPQLKSNAIRSLKEIEDKRASPFVIKALDDPNLIVRESALGYFNRIYEPDVENKLLVMLDDKNYSTRRIVVSALRRFQDKKVIDILVEKIELEDEISVKDQYARTFKILNSKQAVIPLIKMLEDKKMTGRYHTDVIDALSSITKQQFGENTDAWKEWLKNNQNTLIETLKH
jgi:HEAT repeat protein